MSVETLRRRLFFALWPDPVLAGRLRAIAPEGEGRTEPVEDLHLTVLFLGQVPEPLASALVTAASQIQVPRIRQPLTQVEFWPKPGILCVAGQAVPALRQLRGRLNELAVSAGLDRASEHEAFHPHVTLCRSHRLGARVLAPPEPPLMLAAEHFCLAESLPGRTGRRYSLLASWPLA
jgi:2'-5' RNA ligase